MGGYSVSASRGNLQTATFSAVSSGDFLGYFNAITYTGSPALTNQYQQVAGMGYYATGTSSTYGLGGNIAFFTADDGGNTANKVFQAVGIENDQSTHILGNLFLGTGGSTSSYVPATSGGKGSPGQVAWDSTYFYICTATNTWKRVQLNLTSW